MERNPLQDATRQAKTDFVDQYGTITLTRTSTADVEISITYIPRHDVTKRVMAPEDSHNTLRMFWISIETSLK